MAENTLTTVLRHLRGVYATQAQRDLDDGELLERFLASKEESAFAILVQRHGPMVLAVCQRLLRDRHAAEDAFQATFLVLLRRSASLRRTGSLANWLYGVAQRVARRARARDMAQRSRERQAAAMPKTQALDEATWQELRLIVDEEISALPEHQRTAVVLCYLEGKSYEQAAKELGWPKSSLARRLGRGRDLLRERLVARGMTLSGAALAAALAENSAGATLPALLTLNTVKGAVLVAAGKSAAAALSAQAIALAEESMKGIAGVKSAVLAVLLASSVVAGGAGLTAQHTAETTAPNVSAATPDDKESDRRNGDSEPTPRVSAERFTVAGRVLDPNGKPVRTAQLRILGKDTRAAVRLTPTDSNGRFELRLQLKQLGFVPEFNKPEGVDLVASAPGYGLEWITITEATRSELVFRLAVDLPIKGRVVDLEGKPLCGVTVAVNNLFVGPADAFDGMLKTWRRSAVEQLFASLSLVRSFQNRSSLESAYKTTTDNDGRFTLSGLGRDRIASLVLRGGGLADAYVAVATRADLASATSDLRLTIYPPVCTIAMAPSKPVSGIVRDEKTKAPLAGIRVRGRADMQGTKWAYRFHGWPVSEATTNAEGRFVLCGLRKSRHYYLTALPEHGALHVHCSIKIPDTEGLVAPATATIDLRRGVVVTGRVVDAVTGQGVRAEVLYGALNRNEFLFPGYSGLFNTFQSAPAPNMTSSDGHFRLTALPGPGIVQTRTIGEHDYTAARVTPQEVKDNIVRKETKSFLTVGGYSGAEFINGFERVCPAASDSRANVNVTVQPGVSRIIKVVDQVGKPLGGVAAVGLRQRRITEPSAATEFPATALDSEEPRRLSFYQQERKLFGTAMVDGKSTDPITVKLEPLGTATGRFLNKDGTPAEGLYVVYDCPHHDTQWFLDHLDARRSWRQRLPARCDSSGRFRIDELPPHLPLSLLVTPSLSNLTMHMTFRITLRPGETSAIGSKYFPY